MATSPLATLRLACKGLTYQSEIDSPVTAFSWRGKAEPDAAKVRELGRHEAGDAVEEVALGDFFDGPTTEEDWHGDEEKAQVAGFRALLAVLRECLSGLKAFRVSGPQGEYYIVGKTASGTLAGVKATVLET